MEKTGPYRLLSPAGRPSTTPAIVDYLIQTAISKGASDLHLSINRHHKAETPYVVRIRIHGKLHAVKSDVITNNYREIIARFKILSNLDTTETSIPQDGQITLMTQDNSVFVIRTNTIPSQDGEELVARIQSADEKILTLDQLAMTKEMVQRMRTVLYQKSGMIVLNGPAGSGKTTTIYSLLNTLASPERKIITAEDPIEAYLPYVSHMQVSQKSSFATLGRAFMRQDADVIFVGEIRDIDSATATVQLAQTGHLVLTTLHTRDSIGVIPRLKALEIHPNFIATSLIASLSQRLVARLCASCKVEYTPDGYIVTKMNEIAPPPENTRFFRAGEGCHECTKGYIGRLPIYELFMIDPELADHINREMATTDLRRAAVQKGMRSLAEEALYRVYGGYVDLDSVYSYIFGPEY